MDHNRYHKSSYLCSAHRLSQLPVDTGAEIAFAGRSNAGKSSVINTLTRQKRLARTSKQPGRTQQLNFFIVEPNIRLVDLPGYGYAKVPDSLKRHWGKLVNAYFIQRLSLYGLILIVDIRRSLSEQDRQMLKWCDAKSLAVHVLLNKADKLSKNSAKQACFAVERQLPDGCSAQLFSATKKQGLSELIQVMDTWLNR